VACRVFNQIMCSEPKLDSHRFMDIIDAAIASGELKERKAYRKWATEVSKTPRHPNPLAPAKYALPLILRVLIFSPFLQDLCVQVSNFLLLLIR
jgi:hypothetical protein